MKRLYDALTIIAMITTPAAAALFFGWRIYTAALALTGSEAWATVAGLATAITLEAVGMLAGHVASDFWQRGDGRWKVAVGVMALYVVVGMVELWGTTGALVFVLSPAVYLLAALRHTAAIEAVEDAAQAAENHEWQREQERIAAAREHELRLLEARQRHEATIERARIRAESQHYASIEPALVPALQEQAAYLCEDCGQSFATVQALNAHGRWCKARALVESNGHVSGKI
jgi:hypothetical protein